MTHVEKCSLSYSITCFDGTCVVDPSCLGEMAGDKLQLLDDPIESNQVASSVETEPLVEFVLRKLERGILLISRARLVLRGTHD